MTSTFQIHASLSYEQLLATRDLDITCELAYLEQIFTRFYI